MFHDDNIDMALYGKECERTDMRKGIRGLAKMTALLYIEPAIETLSQQNSFGYRTGKAALEAVGKTRER